MYILQKENSFAHTTIHKQSLFQLAIKTSIQTHSYCNSVFYRRMFIYRLRTQKTKYNPISYILKYFIWWFLHIINFQLLRPLDINTWVCYIQLLYLTAIFNCYIKLLYLSAIFNCYIYLLYLTAIFICYIQLLYLTAIFICYIYLLYSTAIFNCYI